MQHQSAKQLLDKYRAGTCSPEEKALLEYWFHHLRDHEDHQLSADDLEDTHNQMWQQVKPPVKIVSHRLRYMRAVAAVLVLFLLSVSGYYFFLEKPGHIPAVTGVKVSHDIAPGGNKATLTLANGRQITLTDARNGHIATENNTLIDKTADGQVVYQNKGGNDNLTYNTVSTPRGGQYSLTLSDGTRVFLNAASSLKYPVTFVGADRRVELSGEAYFEVAHNAARPFRVTTGGQVVEVLGTHFNINSYADESVIKTTLIEGKVRVSAGKQVLLLQPGQQSQTFTGVVGELKMTLKKDADISSDIAWKNGLFQFNHASIKAVMQDAARWYDVDVVYEEDVPPIKVTGQISRKVNLSGLLELMRFAGAKIKTDGKKVIISK